MISIFMIPNFQKLLRGEHYLVVDNGSTVMDSVRGHKVNLDTQFYIGNIPPEIPVFLRYNQFLKV